jgi:hypothetical protein
MKLWLLSLPIAFLSIGCAGSYSVVVNGYSSTGKDVEIPQGASFSVITDSNVPNPILEKEVATKVDRLLRDDGYDTEAAAPDYYLLFDFGINGGQVVTDVVPIHHPGFYYPYRYPHFRWYGYTTYVPYSEVVYTRWLSLKLIDGKTYRASKDAEPLWIGDVASAGENSDLRHVVNYMLIAAFDHFGQDTQRQIVETIPADDQRVLWLEQP